MRHLKTLYLATGLVLLGAVLWFGEIMRRGLYRKLGYSSINQYARTELKFSKTRTGDFIQLARKICISFIP